MTQLTSTKLIFDQSKGYITDTQANLYEVQRQISSGKQYDKYSDMVGSISRVKSLEGATNRIDSYINSINRVIPKLQMVDTVLGQLTELGTELRNNIALRRTPAGDTLDLATVTKNMLNQVEQLLNTKVDGQYIFGGSKTNSAPVRSNVEFVQNYDSSTSSSFTTNTNYFTGDNVELSVRISDGREVSYGITADENAFKELIAAAHVAIESHASENSDQYDLATDTVNAAMEKLLSLQGQNGNDLSALTNARASHETAKLTLGTQLSEITDTDILQASIDVAFNETILQASFQSFARITNLKLIDYL
jgi:flagellar hook-associated protein 3 FlgL